MKMDNENEGLETEVQFMQRILDENLQEARDERIKQMSAEKKFLNALADSVPDFYNTEEKNMKNTTMKMNDAMKLNGGFELTDLERAKIELKETQMKLNGSYIPPEERGDMFSREDAEAQLLETLRNYKKGDVLDNETEAKLEAIKQNNKPAKTLQEARAELKRTQAQL